MQQLLLPHQSSQAQVTPTPSNHSQNPAWHACSALLSFFRVRTRQAYRSQTHVRSRAACSCMLLQCRPVCLQDITCHSPFGAQKNFQGRLSGTSRILEVHVTRSMSAHWANWANGHLICQIILNSAESAILPSTRWVGELQGI